MNLRNSDFVKHSSGLEVSEASVGLRNHIDRHIHMRIFRELIAICLSGRHRASKDENPAHHRSKN